MNRNSDSLPLTSLRLLDVTAGYGVTEVLNGLSIEVKAGELVAILGPSGCGKTTVLRIIAGLLAPRSGDVLFGGRSVASVPAERRGAVMVFQKSLLFPYLTVGENVAFGLKMRNVPKPEIARRVAEALRLVQLEGYGARLSKELSGGQEQRVALARALVTEPSVLLLDEPFSALDVGLRAEMRALVRSLQRRLRFTTLFVTHDQEEAAAIADRIALLLDGRLEQFGEPRDFYTAPRTPAAARFFGWKVAEGEWLGNRLQTELGFFSIPEAALTPGTTGRGAVAFLPSLARISIEHRQDAIDPVNLICGLLEAVVDLGARLRCTVVLRSGESIEIEENGLWPAAGWGAWTPGREVMLRIPPEALRFFLGGRPC